MGARIKLGSLLPAIVTRDHLFPSSTKLIDFTHPSTDCGSLPDIFSMYTQYCNNSFAIEKTGSYPNVYFRSAQLYKTPVFGSPGHKARLKGPSPLWQTSILKYR
jgi:hypothetical protein